MKNTVINDKVTALAEKIKKAPCENNVMFDTTLCELVKAHQAGRSEAYTRSLRELCDYRMYKHEDAINTLYDSCSKLTDEERNILLEYYGRGNHDLNDIAKKLDIEVDDVVKALYDEDVNNRFYAGVLDLLNDANTTLEIIIKAQYDFVCDKLYDTVTRILGTVPKNELRELYRDHPNSFSLLEEDFDYEPDEEHQEAAVAKLNEYLNADIDYISAEAERQMLLNKIIKISEPKPNNETIISQCICNVGDRLFVGVEDGVA